MLWIDGCCTSSFLAAASCDNKTRVYILGGQNRQTEHSRKIMLPTVPTITVLPDVSWSIMPQNMISYLKTESLLMILLDKSPKPTRNKTPKVTAGAANPPQEQIKPAIARNLFRLFAQWASPKRHFMCFETPIHAVSPAVIQWIEYMVQVVYNMHWYAQYTLPVLKAEPNLCPCIWFLMHLQETGRQILIKVPDTFHSRHFLAWDQRRLKEVDYFALWSPVISMSSCFLLLFWVASKPKRPIASRTTAEAKSSDLRDAPTAPLTTAKKKVKHKSPMKHGKSYPFFICPSIDLRILSIYLSM